MGNYNLQGQLNQLESELNRIRNANRALENEISIIRNGITGANRELNAYNLYLQQVLNNCNDAMISSNERVIRAYEVQGEIEKLYLSFKNVERANKKIRDCNNKKYYDFSNYRIVRKIVQGLMDNIDVNMVSNEIITKSIEVSHLQSPDYWLTCVLISIMAWKNEDHILAQRAIERAIALDKKNSSIFYMIFNFYLSRDESSLKWFNLYQQCDLKGSDEATFLMLFSLINKSVKTILKDETREEILNFIKKVIEMNSTRSAHSEEEVVNNIMTYLKKMSVKPRENYNLLKSYCEDYSFLMEALVRAKTNEVILQFILKIVEVSKEEKNQYLKVYIDKLISMPNQAEKEVYDEIAYNETIIKFQGDMKEAKKVYKDENKIASSDLDLISKTIEWVYGEKSEDIDSYIKLNAFILTKSFHEKAYDSYVEEYRKINKNNLRVRIDDYFTQIDFNEEPKEEKKMVDYYTEKKNSEINQINDVRAYISFGGAVLAVIVSFILNYWILVVAAIGEYMEDTLF